ncbi:2Fe-2S iron-sulfur cluster-binding protein [Ramlibacter sp.]|uniref:2Fe-2S iron-sulfur cluster-binding protein n=1 Tax=Ramlibacter sp. TaxID=1917967 RepID=UPI002C1B31E1|nr:2Fe-2S iron-sulfur cluster-binding protein [Ramlibacter sp.]HWI83906.1 2Fe-2S iron-sulfur cluster-binding protein [Ramlibacter sp.]
MSQAGRAAVPGAPEPDTFTVRFDDGGPGFPAGADETLLQAALRAGIELPSSCRNGTCRTCMCQLLSGQVRYRIQWPGLLPEEKAEGWILPCIAYPQTDLLLRRDKPRLDWRVQRDQ